MNMDFGMNSILLVCVCVCIFLQLLCWVSPSTAVNAPTCICIWRWAKPSVASIRTTMRDQWLNESNVIVHSRSFMTMTKLYNTFGVLGSSEQSQTPGKRDKHITLFFVCPCILFNINFFSRWSKFVTTNYCWACEFPVTFNLPAERNEWHFNTASDWDGYLLCELRLRHSVSIIAHQIIRYVVLSVSE